MHRILKKFMPVCKKCQKDVLYNNNSQYILFIQSLVLYIAVTNTLINKKYVDDTKSPYDSVSML